MFGILLAVGAATGYSVTGIFARLGSRAVGPGTGVAIAIFSGLVIVMIPALIWYIPDLLEMPLAGFLWIALMAIIATPAGNLLNFTAIREIGASRSAPLFASSPIFAAILAIIFLGERPNAAIGVGTIGMVAGVIFIVSEGRGRDIAIRSVRTILLGYGCGLGAGLCYGSLNVLAKNAIVNYAPPLAVASMATLFGALMMAPLAAVSVPRALQRSRRSVMMFAFSGVAQGIGTVALYLALERADVVVVSPIVALDPLITLMLASVFLQRLERLTLPVVLGTILIVGGTVLVVTGETI